MGRNSFPMKLDFTRVQNVTAGAASVFFPNPMGPQTYGVIITALAAAWVRFCDPGSGGAAIASASQTVAAPGVFTTATQGFTAGQAVVIQGTAAPGGFTLGTVYYVIAAGLTTTACELSATVGGTGITCTGSIACSLSPLTAVSATNGLLVKATDFAEEYGISPGQYIATIQQGAGGLVNVVELTH
jgi:hypothetical protein